MTVNGVLFVEPIGVLNKRRAAAKRGRQFSSPESANPQPGHLPATAPAHADHSLKEMKKFQPPGPVSEKKVNLIGLQPVQATTLLRTSISQFFFNMLYTRWWFWHFRSSFAIVCQQFSSMSSRRRMLNPHHSHQPCRNAGP
jgi:hypothetical protein